MRKPIIPAIFIIGALVVAIMLIPVPTTYTVHARNKYDPGVFGPYEGYVLLVGDRSASGIFLIEVTRDEYERARIGREITVWRRR